MTGGGWPEGDLPHGLASEGLAMLSAVLSDLRSWGGASTITTLDVRLAGTALCADRIIHNRHEENPAALNELASAADAVLIIAPESEGVLARLSAMVEEKGKLLLGSGSKAIAIAGDKWECFRRFSENKLPTPHTRCIDYGDALTAVEGLELPLVIKPIDGVGCEGVSVVSGPSSLRKALDLMHPRPATILVQPYIAGTHASVSLLVAGTEALPLSLNGQAIEAGVPFVYRGGTVPLDHARRELAFDYAQKAVSLVPGLRGYVGVDMLLTEEECFVVEINPRLTTSYVGLRKVININMAEAVWHACRDGSLPSRVTLSGNVSFDKEELGACGLA